jgi:hypothetical protein
MELADHVVVITGWLIAASCLKDLEYCGYISSLTLSIQQGGKNHASSNQLISVSVGPAAPLITAKSLRSF